MSDAVQRGGESKQGPNQTPTKHLWPWMTKRRKFYTAFLQGLETRAGRRLCFQPTSKIQGQVRHIAHSGPPPSCRTASLLPWGGAAGRSPG